MQLVNILWFGLLITPQAFALDTCAGKSFGYKIANPENPHSYNLCFGFLGFNLPQSCDEGFRFSEETQNCISEQQTSSKTNSKKSESGSLTIHQNVPGNKPIFFNIFGYIWPWSESTTPNAPERKFSTPTVDIAKDKDEISSDLGSTESNTNDDNLNLEELSSTPSVEDNNPSSDSSTLIAEDAFIQLSQDISLGDYLSSGDGSIQDASTNDWISSSVEPPVPTGTEIFEDSSTEANDIISTESSSSSTSEPILDSSPSNSEEPLPLDSFIQLSNEIFVYDSDESSQDSSTESNVSSSEEPLSSTEDSISTESSSSSTSEPILDSSPSNPEEPLPLDSFIQLSDEIFAFDSDESSQDSSTESNVSSSEEPSSSSTEQASSSPEISEPQLDNSSSPVKEVFRDIPSQFTADHKLPSDITESTHDIASLESLNNALMETISLHLSQKTPISKREDSSTSKKPMGLHVLEGNEKLSICSFLPDGTFLRDLRSCSKFFVCTNGRILAGHCPNELYFDIDKRVCNFPSLVACKVDEEDIAYPLNKITLTQTSSIAKSEASKKDTSSVKELIPNKLLSKLLPNISGSKEELTVSEPNEESSTENNSADEPPSSSTLSSESDSPEPEPENNSTEENISGTEEPLSPSEPIVENTSTEESIASSVPPEENSSTEQSILDPESSSSAPESENNSTEESISITKEPLVPTAPSVEENSTDAASPVETTTSDCTGLPNGAFIRDPELCGKFYVCSDGKAIPQYCPGILHFDIKKKVCNFPSLVDCSNDNVQKVSTSLKSTDKLTGVPDCSSLPNGAYVRDDESCNKFYICANGIPIAKQCPRGLYFDITKGYCNMPSLVNCTAKKADHQNSLASGIGLPNCSNKENGATSRDSKMCNKYYICRNGKPTTHYCPPGKWFDINLQICAHKLTVECNI